MEILDDLSSQVHNHRIIAFYKTGVFVDPFLGDSHRTEYYIHLQDSTKAKLSYQNFQASIEYHQRSLLIKPVHKLLTITGYTITDGDTILGEVKKVFSGRPVIVLSDGQVFKTQRVYKNFFDRFQSTTYHLTLSSSIESVTYRFKKGDYFEKGRRNQRYRQLTGEIETSSDDLIIPLLGLFLIELILEQENA